MRASINFNISEDEEGVRSPPNPELEASLTAYHDELMQHCRLFEEEVEEVTGDDNSPGIIARLFGLDTSKADADQKKDSESPPGGYNSNCSTYENAVTCVVAYLVCLLD